MSRPADAARVDIVIPVYNAPEDTRRCIESLYHCVEDWIGTLHVHDNASAAETRSMLDALSFPRLAIHHAERNTGFGDGVNQGVARTSSDRVLVLNSDVVAHDDFIAPLHAALSADPQLAVLTPAGNTFENYDLTQYALRAGCVVSYNLHGYAFLLRRETFDSVGGFDPAFGLGYFEDRDFSRKIVAKGQLLAVHAKARLEHRTHASFERVPAVRELMARNRELYLQRYPGARRHVLIASGLRHLDSLLAHELAELDALMRDGGSAHWLTRAKPDRLPALELRAERLGWRGLRRVMRRQRHKGHNRSSELWLCSDAPLVARVALRRWAARSGVTIREIA
jgi:N-acetylglucosaminyl-diphospho-decaprenol L-rhamnosyltransferase